MIEAKLKELFIDIENNDNYWLFPNIGNVKGRYGDGGPKKIMFVGERPSSAKNGKMKWLKEFYLLLEKYDLGESHLTDLIKSRGTTKEDYTDIIAHEWKYFEGEINIVDPDLVIALGHKVYNYLLFYCKSRQINIKRIDHYSYSFRYSEIEKLSKQLEDILVEIK